MTDFATQCEEAARELRELATPDYYPHLSIIVDLLTQAAAMARDAERYRWLRENIHATPWRKMQPYLMVADDFGGIIALHHFKYPAEADAAIDAAISNDS